MGKWSNYEYSTRHCDLKIKKFIKISHSYSFHKI